MLARLAGESDKAYIARLQGALETKSKLSLKVSEKGAVSVYGMGRFPVTLYKEQWTRLGEFMPKIQEFIKTNEASLKNKDGNPLFPAKGE